MSSQVRLSVIIPTLDEAQRIAGTLGSLAPLRARGHEVIVVDGGSCDETVALARPRADRVLVSPAGRAEQMNRGAAAARGDVLLFLHADTRLPNDAAEHVSTGLGRSGRRWGRFEVRLSGTHPLLRLIEWSMNLRSRLTGIATGDQGIFVERALFLTVGGYPPIRLMEDIALSGRLKRVGRPLYLPQAVVTCSRRWEEQGILRTMALMWALRLAYALGISPSRLERAYYGQVVQVRRED